MSYYQRIAAFLSEYAYYDGQEVPPNPAAIRDTIATLLELGIFRSKTDLQRAALRDYDVIIGDRFFY